MDPKVFNGSDICFKDSSSYDAIEKVYEPDNFNLLCCRENLYVRELLYRVERFNAAGNFYVGSRADTAAENYYIVK